ncbi:MAG: PKD domain-containing protein [Chitinophagaceae bacterium]
MRIILLTVLILGLILPAYTQDFSNKGKEFWIAYGNHVRMFGANTANTPAEKMQLYMTSDVNTTATVEIPGVGFSQSVNITANSITTVDIPRTAALLDEGTYDLGIHVTAAKPIVVYSFIYVSSISGATLCLPVSTLGKTYYSINYNQVSNEPNSHSFFDIIATDTGTTTVEIIPSQSTRDHLAGIPYTIDLKQGQVYQALGKLNSSTSPYSGVDLTGTHIRSIATTASKCKKIAVFCGSGKISIGCAGSGTADNLYQQMYPVSTWGKTYVAVPSINKVNINGQVNFYRIFQSTTTGIVKLNGAVIPSTSFVNGQYYDFTNNITNFIESDQPILVAQYFSTQQCATNLGVGDPEMIYLNPVEQTISSVTLNSMQPSSNTNIKEHYINVVLKSDPGAINSFRIDGVSPGQFKTLPSNPAYSYGQFTVTQGAHTMVCDSGFNAIAYGFGSTESYGYSAGTNLKDLYQFVSIINQYATVNFPAACRNSPFEFSMTFPYIATKLSWQFKGLFADTIDLNPVSDSSWVVNGKTLYRYKLKKSYTITTLGTFPITILAENLTGDDCSGEQEINYDLQVFERPKARFGLNSTGCLSDAVLFKDSTDAGGRTLIKFDWQFGDGGSSVLKSPSHSYAGAGNYTISYSSVSDIGCISEASTQTLAFTDLPVAKFATSQALCETKSIAFTNLSTPTGTSVKSWAWSFGDSAKTIIASPSHAYLTAGNYVATLNMESFAGCKSSFSLPIKVSVNPKPNFSVPQICVSDPQAQFFDSTTIADNTGSLAYLWNFDDPLSDAANPNTSNVKTGVHAFKATGVYQVKLQVTSSNGCVADTTKSFTVNGATPKADFDLAGIAQLCSNKPITILDKSTVDFGSITKLEMYWDYSTNPTTKTTDTSLALAKVYAHTYPEFGAPASRTVQLVYVAYSGITCTQQVSKTIELLATPQLIFDSLSPVCAEILPYQFAVPLQTNGLGGAGVFSGDGVSSTGLFNPGVATAGTHIITYKYTSANSCINSKERIITVFPTPMANAGPDRTVLEGGSITIAATGAPNSKYLWTPTRFLNNANSLDPVVNPTEDIKYLLSVVSGDGCTGTDEMSIVILKSIKVPNAFSPNGDGINDTWRIQYLESYPGATVQVFNRYGQKVFSSVGYSREWNGTINGNPLPTGTYYWIIDPKNGRPSMNGSISIIR